MNAIYNQRMCARMCVLLSYMRWKHIPNEEFDLVRKKTYIKVQQYDADRTTLIASFDCAQYNFNKELHKAKRKHVLKGTQTLSK